MSFINYNDGWSSFNEINRQLKAISSDFIQGILQRKNGDYYGWWASKDSIDEVKKFIKAPNKTSFDNQYDFETGGIRENSGKIINAWLIRWNGKDLDSPKQFFNDSKVIYLYKKQPGLRPIEDVIAEYEQERKRMRS